MPAEIEDRKTAIKALNQLHAQFHKLNSSDYVTRVMKRRDIVNKIAKLLEKLDFQLDPRESI